MSGRMLYIRALSPIHSGTGQSTGVIDLPVAREKITNWPYLPGSSLKGVLRDACDVDVPTYNKDDPPDFYRVFGPKTDNASDRAGALTFCDAHLLCLPVRSFYGTFAWITCPLALDRWREDATAAGVTINGTPPGPPADDHILVTDTSKLAGNDGKVYLEDLDLTRDDDGERRDPARAVATAIAAAIAAAVFPDKPWQDNFIERFGIVGDDLFTALTESGTEVNARIRLSEAEKTVAQGGLWYEEAVPAQAIFAAPVLAEDRLLTRKENDEEVKTDPWGHIESGIEDPRQIGGNASVGRGLAWLRLSANDAKTNGGQA